MQCSETFTALPAFLHVVLKSSQLATDPSIFTIPATKEFFFLFKTSTRTLKLPAINLLKQKKKTEKWNSILNCIQTVHVAVTRHSQKVKRLLILSSPSLMATSLSFDIRQCKLSCQHITTLYKGDMTMNKIIQKTSINERKIKPKK